MSNPMSAPDGAAQPQVGQGAPPAWAALDWSAAVIVALACFIALVVMGLINVFGLVLSNIVANSEIGLSFGDIVGGLLRAPLGYLGAAEGSFVLLTGLAVMAFVARKAATAVGVGSFGGDNIRLLAFAAKVAVVSVVILAFDALILDILDLGTDGVGSLAFGFFAEVDYVRVVLLAGPVIALTVYLATASIAGVNPLAQLGITLPRAVLTSWVGVKRVLVVALGGLLALHFVGKALEILTEEFFEFRQKLGIIVRLLINDSVVGGVDSSTIEFIRGMALLRGDEFFDVPGWYWLGVVIVVAAFFFGGRAAAAAAAPKTAAEAVMGASLIGAIISVMGVVVSIDYQGFGPFEDIAARAILLPLLWTLPALAGAWVYAQQQSLPSGSFAEVSPVNIAPSSPAATSPADAKPAASNPAASNSATTQSNQLEGRWADDPTGRHQLRWWDGQDWTAFVADDGETSQDPLP